MSENCNHDCSSCSQNCADRDPKSFLVPLHPQASVKKIIGVVSGKGGVGKSLVTGLLASTLTRKGYRCAVLDGDITGPSQGQLFGINDPAAGNEAGILPYVTEKGIQVITINMMLENNTVPVIWRGPVLAGVVKQLYSEVIWKDVDYMFVDMPPGTGDVPLTVFQSIPLDCIIVVTSPQELVSIVVSKAINMANEMNIPILGLVENMSYLECGNCGEKLSVFGESHIDEVADHFGLPVLAKLPIRPEVTKMCDEGAIEYAIVPEIDGAVEFIEQM